MSRWARREGIHPAAEAALAFLASAAFFVVAAAGSPLRDHLVFVLIIGGVYVYVVLAAARWGGPLYAVPLAISGGLGLDSFYIPPIRDFGAADWENWLVVAIYLVMGVLIGILGARSQRRAEAAEQAQGRLAQELAASRARIVAAADEERRRVVRDLHDGAQQRLVHAMITLKLARRSLKQDAQEAEAQVSEAVEQLESAMAELRELAHGILPSVLTHGGLRAGVDALASRMPLPVETVVSVDRLPAAVEATAYFVVSEALTNVAKHSRAEHAEVNARIEDGALAVDVRDDGVGGARRDGSGLVGLADRLAALGGDLRIESPADGGTLIAAAIPIPD